MTLLPPRIIGPLSTCSRSALVTGIYPGAEVIFLVDEMEYGGGQSSGTAGVFPLERALEPNQTIKTIQKTDTESSPSDHPDDTLIISIDSERDLSPPIWESHLHRCSECIALAGVMPGADITVTSEETGEVLAETNAVTNRVKLNLSRPLNQNEVLKASQLVCGIRGPDKLSPIPTESPFELSTPVIAEPLIECSTRIQISGVYDGAIVTVERSGTGTHTYCFEHSSSGVIFPESQKLARNETISIKQELRDCDFFSEFSEPLEVRPIESMPKPTLDHENLCIGTTRANASNLTPGSTIEAFLNDTSLGYTGVDSDSQVILLPSLSEGILSVTQTLCGYSVSSNKVSITTNPPPLIPRFEPIPYECSTKVRVVDVRPGAYVKIISSNPGGQIGGAVADDNDVIVNVSALKQDQVILPVQSVCGDEFYHRNSSANPRPVFSTTLNAPTINKVLDSDTYVSVSNIIPGALVEVYVNDVFRGSTVTVKPFQSENTITVKVPIIGRLRVDDQISCIQRLCEREFESEFRGQVHQCKGLIRLGLKTLDENLAGLLHTLARNARSLFRLYNFNVELLPIELLNLPDLLEIEDVDLDDYIRLNQNRNDLNDKDIACYMIHNIIGSAGFHRGDAKGVVVERITEHSQLAHEIGHALGLDHVDGEPHRLMKDEGYITEYSRALIDAEVDIISRSTLLQPC